ncbi:iron chelate uptake ABC transporter family permease subunit [Comamonas sp. JC664]|uniref:iron chelate uptake ABC transporter family permease subunit n=1 Tax=Comamonas sp. JC664 TaxID=2801917 RepID=UPI0036092E1F
MAAFPTSAPASAAQREAAPGLRRSAWWRWCCWCSAPCCCLSRQRRQHRWESVLRMRDDPTSWQIVVDIRLPRSLGAWLAGGLWAWRGLSLRACFATRWPIPILLGSASGASLGSALGLVLLGRPSPA